MGRELEAVLHQPFIHHAAAKGAGRGVKNAGAGLALFGLHPLCEGAAGLIDLLLNGHPHSRGGLPVGPALHLTAIAVHESLTFGPASEEHPEHGSRPGLCSLLCLLLRELSGLRQGDFALLDEVGNVPLPCLPPFCNGTLTSRKIIFLGKARPDDLGRDEEVIHTEPEKNSPDQGGYPLDGE